MQKMMQWETLIYETVQLGGKLVFLVDDAPENLDEWLKPLYEKFGFEIPVVKRHVPDLLHKRFLTSPEDIIFIFSSQQVHIVNLNSVLQGQRVVISEAALEEEIDNADFVWSPCNVVKWTKMLIELHQKWHQLSGLTYLKEAHVSPCLFLDRDDVVVKNVPYNNDPDKVELIPGIEHLISSAHAKGYWVALVTNQSGLGRGLVSWGEYQKVHQRMLQLLAQKGSWIDESVWSAYIEEENVPFGRLYASLRKPRPGMFQMVNSKLKIDMSKSLMVGDSATDLIAAFSAGVGRLFLFHSEKIETEKQKLQQYQKENPCFEYETVTEHSAVKI